MLSNVKQLVVRQRNPLVSVIELLRLRQGQEQPVQTFLADVRSTARHCNFKVSCLCTPSTDVYYTDHMVLHQLLVGLADSEIQEDLLAIDKLTLAVAEKFVMDREAAKRSQGSITTASAARIISSYRKGKSHAHTVTDHCRNCGGPRHQGDDWRQRCPAMGTTCTCGKMNHLPKVCRRKGVPPENGGLRGISRTPVPPTHSAMEHIFAVSTQQRVNTSALNDMPPG